MPVYPEELANEIRNPKFCRSLDKPNAVGSEAKLDCGCFVRIEMRISLGGSAIGEIGYRTSGCGYMTAAAESLSGALSGKAILDLGGDIEIDQRDRLDCSKAVVRAVKNAFADHRSRRIEGFVGEKALICTCFGVTEQTIEEYVRSSHPVEVAEVSESLRAGSGCGSCQILIQEIIDAND